MTCQECEQNIQAFVDDELTGDLLEQFLWHINSCHTCFDEMETSYLLKEALVRLEEGTSFDLHNELKEKVRIMEHYVIFRNHLSILRRVVLTVAGVLLAMELYYVYLCLL